MSIDTAYWTNCRNCGKQVKLDGDEPDEKCYWCHEPALKKGKYADEGGADICGINGGEHEWQRKEYSKGIDRGACDCGAVRFFPNESEDFARHQAALYNEKYGKPGKVYKGPARTKSLKNMPEKPISEAKNSATTRNIKEENMVTEKLGNNLHAGTTAATGIPLHTGDLPPVPPKPDVSGMPRFQARKALGQYYRAHDAEMLADYYRLGDKPTFKRWGCSSCFWMKFRRNHNLPIPLHSGGRRKKTAGASLLSKPSKAAPVVKDVPKVDPAAVRIAEELATKSREAEKEKEAAKFFQKPEAKPELPAILTFKIDVDASGLDAKILEAREKLNQLHTLRLVDFPKFRWFWFPSVQRKWLEIYERLMVGK